MRLGVPHPYRYLTPMTPAPSSTNTPNLLKRSPLLPGVSHGTTKSFYDLLFMMKNYSNNTFQAIHVPGTSHVKPVPAALLLGRADLFLTKCIEIKI